MFQFQSLRMHIRSNHPKQHASIVNENRMCNGKSKQQADEFGFLQEEFEMLDKKVVEYFGHNSVENAEEYTMNEPLVIKNS